jgi:hypothetical protein
MEENTLESAFENASEREQPRALKTILYAGLAVGVLDGIAASVNAGFSGVSPVRVFQYVASGLLGRSSFEGGLATAALGLLLHFVVALGASAVFYAASRFLPILTRLPFVFGPIYGVIVYFVMREIVSPLSLTNRVAAPTIKGTVIMIIIHILFVGLPIALITRKFSGGDQSKTDLSNN